MDTKCEVKQILITVNLDIVLNGIVDIFQHVLIKICSTIHTFQIFLELLNEKQKRKKWIKMPKFLPTAVTSLSYHLSNSSGS